MKIAYGSDFHFEFIYKEELPKIIDRWEFEEGTDLIIIAGDLHVGAENVMGTLEFIYILHGIPIIYVPGNHEYYGSSFERENRIFRHNTAKIEGVNIFEAGYTTKHGKYLKGTEGDVTIIGCAGNIDGSWQDIYQAKHGALNDFYQGM